MSVSAAAARGGDERAEPVSVLQVLQIYAQPVNEEQAWALSFQTCSGLRTRRGQTEHVQGNIRGPASITLHRDGTVSLRTEDTDNTDVFDSVRLFTLCL
ncbi:protein spire homolog 2-like isoform X2 [Hoplias malabaricus]|uniref:protein spire homolog 2-like isoform X2 n=1 Tax=Hoplias malabaricus TaxID=27720 RepID=UPI0034623841